VTHAIIEHQRVRSIPCPVDFSEQSRQALLWASAIAQYRGGEMTVLSVVEPLLAQAAGIRLGVDLAREEAEPALREFVEATLPERVAGITRPDGGDGRRTIRSDSANRSQAEGRSDRDGHAWAWRVPETPSRLDDRASVAMDGVARLAVPAGAVNAPAVEHPGAQLRRILLATDFREARWLPRSGRVTSLPTSASPLSLRTLSSPWSCRRGGRH
jgi:Universal stress protein family